MNNQNDVDGVNLFEMLISQFSVRLVSRRHELSMKPSRCATFFWKIQRKNLTFLSSNCWRSNILRSGWSFLSLTIKVPKSFLVGHRSHNYEGITSTKIVEIVRKCLPNRPIFYGKEMLLRGWTIYFPKQSSTPSTHRCPSENMKIHSFSNRFEF